ncbi:MAG: hypothetical protein ACYCDV_02720 [Facklamia hominis]
MGLFKRKKANKQSTYQEYLDYLQNKSIVDETPSTSWDSLNESIEDNIYNSNREHKENNNDTEVSNVYYDFDGFDENTQTISSVTSDVVENDTLDLQNSHNLQRSRYSYRIDHVLNNGILIVGVLLLLVLLIAFLA